MITLIHGNDIITSRKFFLEQKQTFPDAEIIDGEKITLTDLVQLCESSGLFVEQKTFFIERLFSRKKPRGSKKVTASTAKSDFEIFTDYLSKQTTHSFFLWEGKELDKSALSAMKNATPRLFKLPQTLFTFLDNIKPGNGKLLIKQFHQTLETTDEEMIFFMLIRQFRILLALSDPTTDPIDELKRMAPWQQSKLQQQAKSFSTNHLQNLYSQLLSFEIGQKTGTLSNSILTNIDFFLLEI